MGQEIALTEKQTRLIKVILGAILVGLVTYMVDYFYETHHLGRG